MRSLTRAGPGETGPGILLIHATTDERQGQFTVCAAGRILRFDISGRKNQVLTRDDGLSGPTTSHSDAATPSRNTKRALRRH